MRTTATHEADTTINLLACLLRSCSIEDVQEIFEEIFIRPDLAIVLTGPGNRVYLKAQERTGRWRGRYVTPDDATLRSILCAADVGDMAFIEALVLEWFCWTARLPPLPPLPPPRPPRPPRSPPPPLSRSSRLKKRQNAEASARRRASMTLCYYLYPRLAFERSGDPWYTVEPQQEEEEEAFEFERFIDVTEARSGTNYENENDENDNPEDESEELLEELRVPVRRYWWER